MSSSKFTLVLLLITSALVHGFVHSEKKLIRWQPARAGLSETSWTCPGTSLLWSLLGQRRGSKGVCRVGVPPAGGVPRPGLWGLGWNRLSDIPRAVLDCEKAVLRWRTGNWAPSSLVPGCATRELQLPGHGSSAAPVVSVCPLVVTACHSYQSDGHLAFYIDCYVPQEHL